MIQPDQAIGFSPTDGVSGMRKKWNVIPRSEATRNLLFEVGVE
jgi:hypothetical protein